MQEETLNYDLPVTDVRFYTLRQWTLHEDTVRSVENLIASSNSVVLSVGLSRPFSPDGQSEEVHWLQVNNIFPSKEPLWEGTPEEI